MKRSAILLMTASLLLAVSRFAGAEVQTPPGDGDMVIALSKGELQLNPFHAFTSTEAELLTALYEGLVTYNPVTLDPLPGVARRWEVSPDGTTYTFYLRDDARYWDGSDVTAQDFRDSWLHLIDPKVHAEYASLLDVVKGAKEYRLGKSTDPSKVGIKAIDATTLQVTLDAPASHFLKILCHYSFVPVPAAFRARDDWSTLPTVPGNGPFYVLKRSADEIDLAKNNLYWDADTVELPGIRILLTDDAGLVTSRFNDGTIQWSTADANWDKVRNSKSIVVHPMFSTSYFYFRCAAAPWNDGRVRRALALLLPWDKIRVESELYTPTSSLVPRIASYPVVTGIEHADATEARELLAKAGYAGGANLPPVEIAIPDGGEAKRVAGLMADAWRSEIGLTVDIKLVAPDRYYDLVKSGQFTLATTTWIGDYADPLTFLQMWTSDSNLNEAGYADAQFDGKIRDSMSESASARYETLASAERVLLDGAAVLPLDRAPAINLIDLSVVDGWYPNPLDIHPFKYLRFRTPEPIPGVARSRSVEIRPGA